MRDIGIKQQGSRLHNRKGKRFNVKNDFQNEQRQIFNGNRFEFTKRLHILCSYVFFRLQQFKIRAEQFYGKRNNFF